MSQVHVANHQDSKQPQSAQHLRPLTCNCCRSWPYASVFSCFSSAMPLRSPVEPPAPCSAACSVSHAFSGPVRSKASDTAASTSRASQESSLQGSTCSVQHTICTEETCYRPDSATQHLAPAPLDMALAPAGVCCKRQLIASDGPSSCGTSGIPLLNQLFQPF